MAMTDPGRRSPQARTEQPTESTEADTMGIGGCIALIAVGAILTFAVDWHLSGVNLDLVGLIMMAVGMIGIASYISIFKRRRMQPPPPAAPVIEDHRYY